MFDDEEDGRPYLPPLPLTREHVILVVGTAGMALIMSPTLLDILILALHGMAGH